MTDSQKTNAKNGNRLAIILVFILIVGSIGGSLGLSRFLEIKKKETVLKVANKTFKIYPESEITVILVKAKYKNIGKLVEYRPTLLIKDEQPKIIIPFVDEKCNTTILKTFYPGETSDVECKFKLCRGKQYTVLFSSKVNSGKFKISDISVNEIPNEL